MEDAAWSAIVAGCSCSYLNLELRLASWAALSSSFRCWALEKAKAYPLVSVSGCLPVFLRVSVVLTGLNSEKVGDALEGSNPLASPVVSKLSLVGWADVEERGEWHSCGPRRNKVVCD